MVGMPNYSKSGKILVPLTEQQFNEGMTEGHFCKDKHRGFAALLYYTGVRVTEALRSKKEQFTIQNNKIYFDVGKRLKKEKVIRYRKGKLLKTPVKVVARITSTAPLPINVTNPFASTIVAAIEKTKPKRRVFPYSRKTGYNIIARLWYYPHHLRLTKTTKLLSKYDIPQVKTYMCISLASLEAYIGLATIEKMGEA